MDTDASPEDLERVDDLVEAWHRGAGEPDQQLHEFLGLSWDEAGAWGRDERLVPQQLLERLDELHARHVGDAAGT